MYRTTRQEGDKLIIKSRNETIIINVGKIRYTEAHNRKVDLTIEVGPHFHFEIIKKDKK